VTRLACFYRKLDPRTEASVRKYCSEVGAQADWVETPDSGMTYVSELEKRWTGESDLFLVEEDKEVFPGMLKSMHGCAELWCGYAYWANPEPQTSLFLAGFGLTRFSAELQLLVPVSAFAGDGRGGIDTRLLAYLMQYHGCKMHIHGYTVHHHDYGIPDEKLLARVNRMREARMLPPSLVPPSPEPGILPGSYRLADAK
jgi:hypothetical protein